MVAVLRTLFCNSITTPRPVHTAKTERPTPMHYTYNLELGHSSMGCRICAGLGYTSIWAIQKLSYGN